MNLIARTVLGTCLPLAAVFADTTIDFEDSTGSLTSFESQGFEFVTSTATIIAITPTYQVWALGGATYAFSMTEINDEPFSLQQLEIEFVGTAPVFGVGGMLFEGNLAAGGKVYHSEPVLTYVDNIEGVSILSDQTISFDSSWTNLSSVVVYMRASTNSLTGFVFDNIVVGSGGPLAVTIDVDTAPPNLPVHPDHDGGPGAIDGLNDVIEVVVLGSSTGAGDPVDLDTTTINPATVRFGPAAASVDAGTPSEFNFDYDSDGLDDARFHFLTGDTGIGCADTEVTLTGETIGGTSFTGTDSAFDSACEAECH